MALMDPARTRVGAAVVAGFLLTLGGGVVVATASTGNEQPAQTEQPRLTRTTGAPTITPPQQPMLEAPVADTQADIVEPMTAEPEQASAPVDASTPEPQPESQSQPPAVGDQSGDSYDPYAPFTDAAGVTYVPAPPEPVQPMPGEPGYVPPAD